MVNVAKAAAITVAIHFIDKTVAAVEKIEY